MQIDSEKITHLQGVCSTQIFIWNFHPVCMEISNGFQMDLFTHFQEIQLIERGEQFKRTNFTKMRAHFQRKSLVKCACISEEML